jgi:hypothetical protein
LKIANLDKAEVLVALYNAAKAQGRGFLSHKQDSVFDKEKATQLLSKATYFDYLDGKPLKIDLSGDELDTFLYNRNNGVDAAENALNPLLEQQATLTM